MTLIPPRTHLASRVRVRARVQVGTGEAVRSSERGGGRGGVGTCETGEGVRAAQQRTERGRSGDSACAEGRLMPVRLISNF